MTTKPFFIVSSGRSGTAMLTKALSLAKGVSVEHEYMVHIIQPLSVCRYAGIADAATAQAVLSATHGAAINYSGTRLWGDSSNKLSWLIPDLAALFPDARFIHLARDGRKVAGSYFHKLSAESYDDRSTAIMRRYFADPSAVQPPPPEKKYWWPQPLKNDPLAKDFANFTQFERLAWHWAEVNRVILDGLSCVPAGQKLFLRLEDLPTAPQSVAELFAFLELPYQAEYFSVFARPHNVNRPVDTPLTAEQTAHFTRIASPMMELLGYSERAEYLVNY